jgi:hypothetical protein
LVNATRLRRGAVLLLTGMACHGQAQAKFDYWAWHPRVELTRVLGDADRLYLLAGEWLARDGETVFHRRGFPPNAMASHPIVLVYRCELMQWSSKLQSQIKADVAAFEAKGGQVWGIQLDFDAATRNLDRYGEYLGQVRSSLPQGLKLSVTGLMDWATQGRLSDLNALQGVVDEVVFQVYQGSRPIPESGRYLRRLAARPFGVPFKLGLVEGGDYDPALLSAVRSHPAYLGTVIFLLKGR